MKTKCLSQTRYLNQIVLMVLGVLLTSYIGIANVRRASALGAESATNLSPGEEDSEPEYVEKRDEFLGWFLGTEPEGVSASAYAGALATVRALAPSPLLQGRSFNPVQPVEVTAGWTFPDLTPIYNDWGHTGDPCDTPFPPNSPCGASARIDAIAVCRLCG
jgi:hypothetical protein